MLYIADGYKLVRQFRDTFATWILKGDYDLAQTIVIAKCYCKEGDLYDAFPMAGTLHVACGSGLAVLGLLLVKKS